VTRSPLGRAAHWQIRRLRTIVTGVRAWERHILDSDAPAADVPFHEARTELEEARVLAAMNRAFGRIAEAGPAAMTRAIDAIEAQDLSGRGPRFHGSARLFFVLLSSFRVQRDAARTLHALGLWERRGELTPDGR